MRVKCNGYVEHHTALQSATLDEMNAFIVSLNLCSMTRAVTCLIARGMAERSSPTARLNVIMTRLTLIGLMEAVMMIKIAVNQVVKARNQPLIQYVVNCDIITTVFCYFYIGSSFYSHYDHLFLQKKCMSVSIIHI